MRKPTKIRFYCFKVVSYKTYDLVPLAHIIQFVAPETEKFCPSLVPEIQEVGQFLASEIHLALETENDCPFLAPEIAHGKRYF